MGKFVHLHNHFDIDSITDSACSTKKTMEKVAALGFDAYAKTDHGNISGWTLFETQCRKNGIKPIFGVEGYEAPSGIMENLDISGKSEVDEDDEDRVSLLNKKRRYYHSLLLAKNKKGAQFLYKLVTESYKPENFYYKPRYTMEFLLEHKDEIYDNLIWMSACASGRLPLLLANDREEDAKQYYDMMCSIFGKDNCFVEIQYHGYEDEKIVFPKLVRFAKKYNLRLVGTNDTHYIEKGDFIAREIMTARRSKQTYQYRKDNGMVWASELYLKTEEEMQTIFRNLPEAISNTRVVADMIEDFTLEEKDYHYPNFEVPEGYTADSYLRKIVDEIGEKKLDNSSDQKYIDQINFESESMSNMNVSAYMLVVADYIQWAKDHDIVVGPGRGSACGSEIAYCSNITEIEPMRYNLFYERFLNPERVTMPDIDVDFQDDRRQQVMEYVVQKYGADHVAQILTLGTMAARMSIRDTGAVLEIEPELVDKIAKLIPKKPGMTIDEALNVEPLLAKEYKNNKDVKLLLDISRKVEGLVRHTGIHAAGLIISDKPLVTYGALLPNSDEDSSIPVFAGDMAAVGDHLKLMKADFLGLKTLTVEKYTLAYIKKNLGIDIDINKIDIADPKVYEFIATGKTDAIFQLESPGMQKFMKNLEPESIEDLIAGISLFRPGPMDQIPTFIKNKQHPESIVYPEDVADKLKKVLDVTYGVIVYQEQVMELVRSLGGYSYGRSDLVRRAMSKKKESVMKQEKEYFINGIVKDGVIEVEGCLRRGITQETANNIFDLMMDFASYAFNKSHATAYAVITYQTAWLRYYYPKEYFTAYLNSIISDTDKLQRYMATVKEAGIKIMNPDINESEELFLYDSNGIRIGLKALKNVGIKVYDIIDERRKNGKFKDLENLILRCNVDKRSLESLVKSGALDTICEREEILRDSAKFIKNASKAKAIHDSGQITLFDTLLVRSKVSQPYSMLEKFRMEKEVSSMYLTGHPLELDEFKNFVSDSTIKTIDEFSIENDQDRIVITGIIDYDTKKDFKRVSKKGNLYAIFQLQDKYSSIDVMMFEKNLLKCEKEIKNGNIVVIHGTLAVSQNEKEVENENGEVEVQITTTARIFAENIQTLS